MAKNNKTTKITNNVKKKSGFLTRINKLITITTILSFMWANFWMLNGMDKFFNGTFEPMVKPGLEKSVITDKNRGIRGYIYAYETNGLLGVNRNAKMKTFFGRVGVTNEKTVYTILNTIAIYEIFISLFFYVAVFTKNFVRKNNLLEIGYKLSLLLFLAFTAGDILFGERIELWEHMTFVIALIVSYWEYKFNFISKDKIK